MDDTYQRLADPYADVVQTRLGHYAYGDTEQTALVVFRHPSEPMVNVIAFTHTGDPVPHIGVPITGSRRHADPGPSRLFQSFHLVSACPGGSA